MPTALRSSGSLRIFTLIGGRRDYYQIRRGISDRSARSDQNPGDRSPDTPNALSSSMPTLPSSPSSNNRPTSVIPWGTRRGGSNLGSGLEGSGAQSLRASDTSTNP